MALRSGLWIMGVGWMGWMDDPSMRFDESFLSHFRKGLSEIMGAFSRITIA
jgi:hypothetical protein